MGGSVDILLTYDFGPFPADSRGYSRLEALNLAVLLLLGLLGAWDWWFGFGLEALLQ